MIISRVLVNHSSQTCVLSYKTEVTFTKMAPCDQPVLAFKNIPTSYGLFSTSDNPHPSGRTEPMDY